MENILKVYKNKDYYEFYDENPSEKRRFYISSNDHLLLDIKNYINLLSLKNIKYQVYLGKELFREDRFIYEKEYEKYAKKISFWEVIKKYECDVDDIYIAQKVIKEKDQVIVDCYAVKKEIMNEIKAIYEKNFNKIIKISPEDEAETDFLEQKKKHIKNTKRKIYYALMFILIVTYLSKNILNISNKKNNINSYKNMHIESTVNNGHIKKLILNKRKAQKNTKNLIFCIKRLSKIISSKSYIKEYIFTNGVEKISGEIEGDYNNLLDKIKLVYPLKLIKIESIKDEGINKKSFCFSVGIK